MTATGKYRSLFETPLPAFYVPIAQDHSALRVLHVRTRDDAEALAPVIERTIHEREPDLTLYDVQSMTRALRGGRGLFLVRMAATFTAILGAIALALAAVGLYAVIAYAARQRTHEIGVRMALGATGADITRLVLWSGLPLVALGLAAGRVAGSGTLPLRRPGP